MHELCGFQWPVQRSIETDVYGGGRAPGGDTPLHRQQGVVHGDGQRHVARYYRDRLDRHLGVHERHHQRDGVVRGGVGVDDDANGHSDERSRVGGGRTKRPIRSRGLERRAPGTKWVASDP